MSQLLGQRPFVFSILAALILRMALGPAAGWLVPVVGLVTIGIGHGSVDHLLSRAIEPGRSFYVRYLGRMGLFLAAWFIAPAFALGFFIFQTADHFGEANWIRPLRCSGNDPLVRALARIWGLFAALFGVLVHWNEALPVIQGIVGWQSLPAALTSDSASLLATGLFLAAFAAAIILDRYEERATLRPAIGVPATVLLGGSLLALPLLEGFLCFFAYWHAWDTMKIQKLRLGWTSRQYWQKAAPYTALACAAMLGLWLLFADALATQSIWTILFVALGALTAGHAPVMKRFLLVSRKKRSPGA